MINIIRADQRHFSDIDWLQTYWLFSFSDYYDPGNVHWGSLRVFNDDVVQPGAGFPPHPHREMEIVTVVLSGEMTHRDSTGVSSVIKAGEVQRMSAGTGITHSEFNVGSEPVHIYQIWIFPDEKGLIPSYDQKSFAGVSRQNELLPVASGQDIEVAVKLHTDATIYQSELEPGYPLTFDTSESRRVFIYVTEGDLSINGTELAKGDQARIASETKLTLESTHGGSFMLIDVPA